MEGMPGTVNRMAAATMAPAPPTWEATRVTSWLPMKVCGTKVSHIFACRPRVQSSSQKLRSLIELQVAFQSSYSVTVSSLLV